MGRDSHRRKDSASASRSRSKDRRRKSTDHHAEVSTSSDSEVEATPFVSRYTGQTGCMITESVRAVDTVCGTHTYTMTGYTLARAMGSGTRLVSDLFEVGGQLFRIEVYPAGVTRDTAKYVSLFLTTPGSLRPGHLLYELSILDRSSSKPAHVTEARTAAAPPPPDAAAVLAPCPGVVAGFPKFIKANFLHRNARRFLADDTLVVRCTVKVLTGRSSFPMARTGAALQPQLFALHPTGPMGGMQARGQTWPGPGQAHGQYPYQQQPHMGTAQHAAAAMYYGTGLATSAGHLTPSAGGYGSTLAPAYYPPSPVLASPGAGGFVPQPGAWPPQTAAPYTYGSMGAVQQGGYQPYQAYQGGTLPQMPGPVGYSHPMMATPVAAGY
ncbi:hypothetical protein HYH03_014999 [Edaphochlamys debaryana]|uniref:MATH domain-containing protein n=1 Tax=Edaphochlamys debaryana TaxID=47281 RepID=A0A836BSY5_9CHLO|nr:hypothetical protein HYH03_014999 [Edaphochlamys debaryana]|eukprot:KAG2486294.1 hypothetical protein HYH03_014999 [Edaphochlamys debaryana]